MVMEIIISVFLLFAGIAILLVIHVCVVGRAFRGVPFDGPGSIPIQAGPILSMDPEDIKKLPCFDYGMEEGRSDENVDCAVCLEIFKRGEKCRILAKCKHSFHAECIDSWLMKTGDCPICRTGATNKSPQLIQGNNTCNYSGDVGVELI